MSERAQSFKDTLASHALACMKKRMQDSAPLALRTLSVLAITLGPDEQDFYDGTKPCIVVVRYISC